MKWVDFVNLFTISQIESFFLRVRGNPTTMSILIYSHIKVGTPIFWIPPPSFICLALTCWQYWHLDINSAMSLFKPSHEYASLGSQFILVAPRWIEYQEPWYFPNTFFLKSSTSGTHNLFWYLRAPFPSFKEWLIKLTKHWFLKIHQWWVKGLFRLHLNRQRQFGVMMVHETTSSRIF